MVNRLKDYIFLGYPFFTFLGFLHVFVYYHYFNITIQSYLDLSEIITIILDKTVIGSFFAGLFVLSSTYIELLMKVQKDKNEGRVLKQLLKNEKSRSWFDRVLPIMFMMVLLVGLGIMFVLLIRDTIRSKDTPYFIEELVVTATLIIIIIGIIFFYIETYDKINIAKQRVYVFVATFLVSLSVLTFLQIRNVKYYNATIGTEINYFENDNYIRFVSDSTNYFIGKTNNYVFIFNSNNSTAKTIPMKNVDQIVLVNTNIYRFNK